jgi:beta-glucanase (GH16 family)
VSPVKGGRRYSRSMRRATLIALAGFLVIAAVLSATADAAVPAAASRPAPPATASPARTPSVLAPSVPALSVPAPPWAASPSGCTNFGNADEREWYLPSQVHVGGGALALVAQHTPTSGYDKQGNQKTYSCRSGIVTTYPSVRFTYGFVQVTARLPFGTGLWPAIWLVPSNGQWPPEIDIIEHWGTDLMSRATLHTAQGTQQKGFVATPDADWGWHTFTLYWTPSRISVYYDSQLALTATTGIPQQDMYLLLDLADNSDSPGSCSGTMYVKSVAIWQPS